MREHRLDLVERPRAAPGAQREVRRRRAAEVVEPDAASDAGAGERRGPQRAPGLALLRPPEIVVLVVAEPLARREQPSGALRCCELLAEDRREPRHHRHAVGLPVGLADPGAHVRPRDLAVEIDVLALDVEDVVQPQCEPDGTRVCASIDASDLLAREQPIDLVGAQPVVGEVARARCARGGLQRRGGVAGDDALAHRAREHRLDDAEDVLLRLPRDGLAGRTLDRLPAVLGLDRGLTITL
nr:hypothetical protein [Sandaracinus amylolyticus]